MKILKNVTKGLPQTGLQGGAGVAVFYAHRMLAAKIPFVQKQPLAVPVGLILLGHLLKKSGKLGSIAPALIGAGGYAGAQVFEMRKALSSAPQVAPAQTSGFEQDYDYYSDTGAVTAAADIGMLMESTGIGDLNEQAASAYDDAYGL